MNNFFSKLVIFLVLTGVVTNASVHITGVKYIQEESMLVFTFDQNVRADNIILSGITLGNFEDEINLGNGARIISETIDQKMKISLLYKAENGNIITIQKDRVEQLINRNNIFVNLDENVFINTSNTGNDVISEKDSLFIQFIPQSNKLMVQQTVYMAETNILQLIFNKKVKADPAFINYQKIIYDGKNLINNNNELITISDNDTINIRLGMNNQKIVESADSGSEKISIAAAFRDSSYNLNHDAIIDLIYIEDPDPLKILSAQYNAGLNKLYIYLNRQIKDPRLPQNFFPGGIRISDMDGINSSHLPYGYNVFASRELNNTCLVVRVSSFNQKEIESNLNTSQLRLSVKDFTIYDYNDNGNSDTSNVNISFIPDSIPFKLDIARCEYDGNLNQIIMVFNKRLHTGSGFNYGGLSIKDPKNPLNILSFEMIEDLTFNFADKRIKVQVPADMEAAVEKFADIQLIMDPFVIFSKENIPNGNLGVSEADNAVITNYVSDSTGPEIKAVEYDVKKGNLHITFDEAVNFSTFDPSKIRFCNVPFDNMGNMTDNFDRDLIIYKVSEAVRSALESIPEDLKTAPVFTFQEGMVRNFYEKPNPEIVDGRDGNHYLVGYGRFFWVRGKEKFPSRNLYKFASLRKTGEKADIYVENEQWRVNVTEYDVDSLMTVFEQFCGQSALHDSLRYGGMYHMLTTVFGDIPVTEDDKIHILLHDIKDDYRRGGRNLTNQDIYNFGYVEARDTLSIIDDPHSNESKVIYIDTNPQRILPRYPDDQFATGIQATANVFHKLIALYNYPGESRWLTEGLSALCQFFVTDTLTIFQRNEEIIRAPGTELTHFYDHAISRKNFANTMLFNLFLYERYGLNFIQKLARMHDKTGMDKISWLIRDEFGSADPYYEEPDAAKIFADYAIASLVDQVEYNDQNAVTNHQYGFINVNLQKRLQINFAPGVFFDENITNIKEIGNWSFNFYTIPGFSPSGSDLWNEVIPDNGSVRINATDNVHLMMFGATQNRTPLEYIVPEFRLINVNFNERNEGILPLQFIDNGNQYTFRQDYKGMMLILVNPNQQPVAYAFSNDVKAPQYARLGIMQNALINRSFDFYLVSNEALYTDISENPEIKIVTEQNNKISLNVTRKFENAKTDLNTYLYNASYNFSLPGTYHIEATARDISGNELNVSTASVHVLKKYAGKISQTATEDGFVMKFEKDDLEENQMVFVFVRDENAFATNSENDYISKIYSVYSDGNIDNDYKIKIPLIDSPEEINYSEIGLFQWLEGKWQVIPAYFDQEAGLLTARVSGTGTFQVRKSAGNITLLPQEFYLYQNYPNPFNPETTIRFDLPQRSIIKLTIYDILGQKIKSLKNGYMDSGHHKIIWKGNNENGFPVASGLYFYELRAQDFRSVKRMLILR